MLESSKLSNLQNISVRQSDYCDIPVLCKNDHLLYRSIRRTTELKMLRLHCIDITQDGMKELVNTLSSNQSIEFLELECWKLDLPDCDYSEYSILKDHKLVKAALSIPSIKTLETNIPFYFPQNETTSLKKLKFEIWPYFLDFAAPTLFRCLRSIADMCRLPSMESLEISYDDPIIFEYDPDIPYHWHCDFIAVLNNSLHINPSMNNLFLDPFFFNKHCLERSLPEALHKDVDAARLILRRSASQHDLGVESEEDCKDNCHFSSCPDLPLVQSICDIHPLLYNTLKRHPTMN